MATEAQIQANSLNAQKSSGPRTAAGKAVVAQNAVKHGLLGEQVVVAGEDRARFARHRDEMLRALGPVDEVEITLAERVIGLSWRLQRVQRLQVQAFEALCAGPGAGPAAEGSDEELALGRIVVKDFSEARVLDRLLMYERRLEHSLCRILGELRKEHLFHNLEARTMDEGQPQVLLERLMGKLRDSPSATLRVERGSAGYEETPAHDSWAEAAEQAWEEVAGGNCQASEGRAALETSNLTPAAPEEAPDGGAGLPHATERVGQAASNATQMPRPSCETHPVGAGSATGLANATRRVSGPFPGSGFRGPTPDRQPLVPEFSCETNPIWSDAKGGQVLDEKGVMSDLVQNRFEETNPIFAENEPCQCLVEPAGAGQALAAGPAR
jgi:hypothetical protein